MEDLGVIFAIAMLLLLVLYWTIFPTVLNFGISAVVAAWLGRERGFLFWLVFFLITSLMLTFATRLPDFLYDAANVGVSDRAIEEVLRLAPGDTLYLKDNYPPIEQRGGYFSTPSYAEHETAGRIVGPKFYFEDLVGLLRGMGLRIVFGEQREGAAILLFVSTKNNTHQQLELVVQRDGRQLAHYKSLSRLRFWDELGDGHFRLHLQHLAKNTLWNYLLLFNEERESQPVSNFIKEAIRVTGSPELQ